jgi:hypothetical protein
MSGRNEMAREPQAAHRSRRAAGLALGAAAALAPLAPELRVRRSQQPLTDRWSQVPVEPRQGALLGLSFRPRQAETFGLDPREALRTLLPYPFQVIRLGAYWNRMEPAPGRFDPFELDWQVDAAEEAGKQVIICLGPVKTFGYPEFFVPEHRLPKPLPEGALIRPDGHGPLLRAGTEFIARVIERYRSRRSVVAWQVEHEAVDPLGLEHSWRLSAEFVRREVEAARAADPSRPVMMNGFLPTSTPVRLMQWWRSRDQGDSLAVARDLADVVGIDFYPRHAVAGRAGVGLYLDGGRQPWQRRGWTRALRWAARAPGRRVMIAEGQAEPWEAVTTPPDPKRGEMYSCRPEHVIGNYNEAMRRCRTVAPAWAYLFWGAEYWLLRAEGGDRRYIDAFARVATES